MPECTLWEVPCPYPHDLILAGDLLFLGGDDEVAAFSAETGDKRWTCPVRGRAQGLAVATGGLYVSTNQGDIVRFREAE